MACESSLSPVFSRRGLAIAITISYMAFVGSKLHMESLGRLCRPATDISLLLQSLLVIGLEQAANVIYAILSFIMQALLKNSLYSYKKAYWTMIRPQHVRPYEGLLNIPHEPLRHYEIIKAPALVLGPSIEAIAPVGVAMCFGGVLCSIRVDKPHVQEL
mmetsp:Transcript_34920/g.56524  ORF Transcript_34920/g.56524 Transcript_34920/m.56524 type:complete len:159 (-) Transcript_34920:1512-1988(-)